MSNKTVNAVSVIESPKKQGFFAKNKAKFAVLGGAVAPLAMATPAHAAFDVSNLVTEISGNSQSVQTIMLAVLTISALFVGFMFIKRSLR